MLFEFIFYLAKTGLSKLVCGPTAAWQLIVAFTVTGRLLIKQASFASVHHTGGCFRAVHVVSNRPALQDIAHSRESVASVVRLIAEENKMNVDRSTAFIVLGIHFNAASHL